MENKKPLILVSNDDGVMAKGINELVRFFVLLGTLWSWLLTLRVPVADVR